MSFDAGQTAISDFNAYSLDFGSILWFGHLFKRKENEARPMRGWGFVGSLWGVCGEFVLGGGGWSAPRCTLILGAEEGKVDEGMCP